MPLEKQVVSLDLAKRLHELGVRQESLFYWNEASFVVKISYAKTIPLSPIEMEQRGLYHSAFTVAELGEMLWNAFDEHGWDLLYKAYGEAFDFKGTQHIGDLGIVNLMRAPDMAAKMLIYLIENKLMSV